MVENLQRGPEYVSRAVDHTGWIASQLGDLQGFDTMACELIQNADDAGATVVEFAFYDDRLEVSNDGEFTACDDPLGRNRCSLDPPCDFHSFRSIAGRGKRDREGTTGVFGVGFTSVYQVTDHPELVSSGYHLVLDETEPEQKRIKNCQGCELDHDASGSHFILPWVTATSDFRRALERMPLTRDKIQSFPHELVTVAQYALLFLRNLEKLTVRVNRETWTFERMDIDGKVVLASPAETTEWLVLSSDFNAEAGRLREATAGIIPSKKSARVRVAVPSSAGLIGGVHATLPTSVTIPIGIRLDGDLFPSVNRKSVILESDHRSSWNRFAIKAAASAFASNLESVAAHTGHSAFWSLVQQAYMMSNDGALDSVFGAFWDEIARRIGGCAVLPTISGAIVTPSEARYPNARSAFDETEAMLNLQLSTAAPDVFDQLRLLPRAKDMQLADLTAKDVIGALLLDNEESPVALTSDEASGVRRLLNVLLVGQVRAGDVGSLNQVAIMPLVDGRLATGNDSFRMSDETWAVFSAVAPGLQRADQGRLREECPALEQYCLEWEQSDALDLLEAFDSTKLENHFRSLLRWFRGHSSDMDDRDRDRLADLEIWPTGHGLVSLTSAALPGFNDPIGIATLLSLDQLEGLVDLARELGAEELSVGAYLRDFAVPAVCAGQVSVAQARKLLRVITDHRADLEGEPGIHGVLSSAPIVETTSGQLVPPNVTYFSDAQVAGLGEVPVTPQADTGSAEAECLRWLGVQSHGRIPDVIRAIGEIADTCDSDRGLKLFESMSNCEEPDVWEPLSNIGAVRDSAWLPSKRGTLLPSKRLVASFNQILFDTQDQVFGAPLQLQQRAQSSGLLGVLGIAATPPTWMIVAHLLASIEQERPVREQVYETLNRASSEELAKLRGTKCILIGDVWRRPDEIYWSGAPFGRYSALLGDELRSYANFFEAVGVKESPDAEDCVEVLARIGEEFGHDVLDAEAADVVFAAWRLLNDFYENGVIDEGWLTTELAALPSILAADERLRCPDLVVFLDAQEHASRFQLVSRDLIPRRDGVWRAQLAAGVRPFETLTAVELDSASDPEPYERLHDALDARRHLVKAIFEYAEAAEDAHAELDKFRFTSVSDLAVRRRLSVFNREETQFDPDPQCFMDLTAREAYIKRTDRPRWKLVAREIALGLVPDIARELTPLLAAVIEEETTEFAQQALSDLGVPLIELLPEVDTSSPVATEVGTAAGDIALLEEYPERAVEAVDASDFHETQDKVEPEDPASTAGGNAIPDSVGENLDEFSSSDGALTRGGATQNRDGYPGHRAGREQHDGAEATARKAASRRSTPVPSPDAPQTRMVSYVIPTGSRDARLAERYESQSPEVERAGVDAVLEYEMEAGRVPREMPAGNHGFDVASKSTEGELLRVIEVKATAGRWAERGVPLSARQYEECRQRGDLFWLYIVEFARDDAQRRVVRIQNPASKAAYFAIDRAWDIHAESDEG